MALFEETEPTLLLAVNVLGVKLFNLKQPDPAMV